MRNGCSGVGNQGDLCWKKMMWESVKKEKLDKSEKEKKRSLTVRIQILVQILILMIRMKERVQI